ncbi:malonyl-ACP O-methyltransferase BioC [Vibrio sp. MA40-2]|uniref:malonyl-ACP O-methyltransferase BioC n=1 Tax=Vibrio sp. MA40-2 TaxID=3391828 RepID=UPI0039A43C7F
MANNLTRKAAIAQAFSKAASNYDQHAQFQRQVGRDLLAQLPLDLKGLTVLDIGCGTGYFCQCLAERGAQVVALDLSLSMLKQTQIRCQSQTVQYCQADAEALPFVDQQFDMVFSSLALQWCDNLAVPLNELQRVTKPGGKVVFSTLMAGSLIELQQAWSKIDSHQHVNVFLNKNQIKIALAQSGSQNHHLNCYPVQLWYSSAFNLMRDLKGIGATHVSDRAVGLTKRHTLLRVEKEYQRFTNNNNLLPATYQVCLGTIFL